MLKKVSMIFTVLLVSLVIGATTAWTLDGGSPLDDSRRPGVPNTDDQLPAEVPFSVLEPQSLPDGYELAQRDLLSRGQSGSLTDEQAREVTGVVMVYLETETAAGAQKGTVLLEQKLGRKNSGYSIGHASKTGEESIRGFNTDVWDGRNVNDVAQTILVWEDTDIGVRYTLATYLPLDEARAVAASLL